MPDHPESKPLRADLDLALRARAERLDDARPAAVAQQRKRGRWTARESLAALLDAESFVEYGGLARPAVAGMDGAADGIVMGTGRIDGRSVDLLFYDYTVYAGTQSTINHAKSSRMFAHAEKHRLPVICWLDGGGARPHDMKVEGRGSTPTFVVFARLSGLVPTIGILPGRAFAGHANLAGMCDVLIATKDSAMGMAGPPLVEAALGVKLTPEEIGPASVHVASGVIDVLVEDEAEAIAAAKKYLGYFGGPGPAGDAPDAAKLRDIVPDNPKRAYNVRKVIEGLADVGSVLELKPSFGRAVVTSFIRLGGRPVGVVANQPMFLAGAIDSPASEKAARFIQICDAFDIPMLLLCDTPGLMVGPDVEKTGLVRRSARVLAALANATVPVMTVVLRKAYGLGYYIMGSQPLDPAILLAWPTAEFGGMGLEGAVNIIYRRELDAIADEAERAKQHKHLTDDLKRKNTATEAAARFLYDDVIDPADTRAILLNTLATVPPPPPRTTRKRFIEPM
ncbi:acyl-CoA carboxylase subunit beta [Reyranella sp. CPCC 100927]|uniref:acyl-CoA carboxylase subunit beta n=1 Tax=Reyranella sp. CPCC 100927 TaxID=2599616 RepID=UPI0011B43F8A|nr:carboxyl transferase domain-containing protein [Reyranella sp. CPCC 100927]TWT01153.1 biotin carboxylase [Reyranella sp. CPCC 100927]